MTYAVRRIRGIAFFHGEHECPSELSWRLCQGENVNQQHEEEEQWLQAERS